MFINKDNKEKLFFEQKTITPMKSKNGDVNFFVSVAQDITKLVNESKDYKLKAYKDKLTGLYNRLKFDEEIEMKFFEYHINSRLFSIMIIDIDHFKYVNDTFGHDKGDEVLKDLAHVLKDTLRSSDFISRWGGEEFVVIIDSKIELATEIANKIIQAIETKIKIGSHVVTASAGVTQVRYEDTQESLFTRIDAALYESKNNGRNRVISIL
jgi:diguanylate cyclase (GGDEF)-like protein